MKLARHILFSGLIAGIAISPAIASDEILRNNPDTIHAPFGVYTHAVTAP